MKIRIPTSLLSYTGSLSVVDASGSTLEQISRDLDRKYPGIRFRIIDEQDQIRAHVKIFLNGNQILDLSAKIADLDEIEILQAFSGG